jgi:hypothetical protein
VVSCTTVHSSVVMRLSTAAILPGALPRCRQTPQVELRFRSGSLVMIGTAAILSWTGSIILEPVREEFAEIIKIATQRAIGAAMALWAPGADTFSAR